MKRLGRIAGFGVVLALAAGGHALALEEQRGAVVPPPATADAPKAEVQGGSTLAKPETGTEIRIPGIGIVGKLPKMDFGLELLYGAADGKQPQDTLPSDSEPGDLTIKGRLKHEF